MKKILIAAAAAACCVAASAATFWYQGALMGTVCRSGPYFTVYPPYMAQPVGTSCPVRDGNGYIIGTGVVTSE